MIFELLVFATVQIRFGLLWCEVSVKRKFQNAL